MTSRVIVVLVLIAAAVVAALYMFGGSAAVPGGSGRLMDTVSYSCDAGKSIVARYYEPAPVGSAMVSLSDGRSMTLAQTVSADGVRYANSDESFVFWSRGNGALVLENNQKKSYIGCIKVAPEPALSNLTRVYSNSSEGFSLRLPGTATSSDTFKVDPSYRYQALGPGRDIAGVRFTIPASMATGTNLSNDSYLSVEEIPRAKECSAALFVSPGIAPVALTDGVTAYSVATSSDAGLGNRYEETVYALPGTNPCIAVRYFVHYGAFENYPPGMVRQFDREALLALFDSIRRTLVISE